MRQFGALDILCCAAQKRPLEVNKELTHSKVAI